MSKDFPLGLLDGVKDHVDISALWLRCAALLVWNGR